MSGLGHVLVGDQTGVDLERQGQPAEDGEGQRDPSGAADPVADPLQRGQRGQQDELDQRDVGQDLRPVGHRVLPPPLLPPMSPRAAAVPSPGVPDPELLGLYSSPALARSIVTPFRSGGPPPGSSASPRPGSDSALAPDHPPRRLHAACRTMRATIRPIAAPAPVRAAPLRRARYCGPRRGRWHGAGLGTAGGALGDRGQGPRAPAGLLRRPLQLADRRRLHHGDPAPASAAPSPDPRRPHPRQRAVRRDPLRPGGRPAGLARQVGRRSAPPSWPSPSTSPAARRWPASPTPRAIP